MDARSTVTAKEWGSLPPEAAKFEATPPGHFLLGALGPATVASPNVPASLDTLVPEDEKCDDTHGRF